jgi:hypothetical protein
VTGRMKRLPRWTQEGSAVVGLMHCEVRTWYGYSTMCPYLRCGCRTGIHSLYDGDRLQWNWQLKQSTTPDWHDMVDG